MESIALIGHIARIFTVGGLISLVLWIIANEYVRSRARIPGLDGPRGWPVIGNYLDIRSNAAVQYEKWAKKYGDVYQVQLGNTTVVVVNSPAAAKALFMSNSQALSSRPVTYTFHKVASTTAGLTIGASPYDDSLKRKKKGIAAALNRPAIQSYHPYFDRETRAFISDLLRYGEAGAVAVDPLPMIQRLSLSLVMTINWGVRVASVRDPLFREIVAVEEELNRARSTVGNAQDHIPLLRLNPFNATSATARAMRARRDAYLARLDAELAEKVEKATATNPPPPCIQTCVLESQKEIRLDDAEFKAISLSVLGGGFETVSNTVQWTIAYLAQNPGLQDRAYEEICRFQQKQMASSSSPSSSGGGGGGGVVEEPLCDAQDDQRCAYVLGLAKEALRYFSVIPLALPRESIRDVVYEGVRIPKGSTVYLNAWACNHDPEMFPDPHTFDPERWIQTRTDDTDPGTSAPPIFGFGIGYRMCAGHLLAMRELYLIYMRLLASFRIVVEKEGEERRIECDPSRDMKIPTDLIMAPRPYRVVFVPRDEKRLRDALARTAGMWEGEGEEEKGEMSQT
ncbi:putative cytochrome P450 phenylacetate hydroxylase [Xylariaceae sp. FL0594]|nr:putative cytochrome P450 phenylacetate hydroxylase [Xylariaceae sp. FL0594]